MIELLTDPTVWLAFLTLTLLEIVLGIDNIIFLSILVSKLPKELQPRGRILGLAFAMVTRIALLFSITWLIRLTAPLFTELGEEISGRDLILIAGGLFLLAKSTHEIHDKLEGHEGGKSTRVAASYGAVLAQNLCLCDQGHPMRLRHNNGNLTWRRFCQPHGLPGGAERTLQIAGRA